MLYFKCPTCRTLLADKQIPYMKGMEKICSDPKLSQKEKDKQKKELLDSLYLERLCCRMRMLSFVDIIDIVK